MKRHASLTFFLLLFLIATASLASAQNAAAVAVAVGDDAPDFTLSDSKGTSYQLSDFRGEKAVVLEFFRSGGW